MNGASPVRFVLSLLYMCVLCVWLHLIKEQSQPVGRERRPACPQNGIGSPSLGAGIV